MLSNTSISLQKKMYRLLFDLYEKSSNPSHFELIYVNSNRLALVHKRVTHFFYFGVEKGKEKPEDDSMTQSLLRKWVATFSDSHLCSRSDKINFVSVYIS